VLRRLLFNELEGSWRRLCELLLATVQDVEIARAEVERQKAVVGDADTAPARDRMSRLESELEQLRQCAPEYSCQCRVPWLVCGESMRGVHAVVKPGL